MSKRRALRVTPNLTTGYSPEIERQIRTTYLGMAHFANTGPFGTTCKDCAHLGYWKQQRNAAGDTIATSYIGGCAMYRRLTGKDGPVVPPSAGACRYFKCKETK